jgi:hypothetical protein
MDRKALPITQFISLLLLLCITACGGTPTQPDNSREEMEERRDSTFRELK